MKSMIHACAAAMLLCLSFQPSGFAEGVSSPVGNATLILKNGERFNIKLTHITDGSIYYEMPDMVPTGKSDNEAPPRYQKGIVFVKKIILAGGDEKREGIILKSGDKICGKAEFNGSTWTVMRSDVAGQMTLNGIDQVRSIDFVSKCLSEEPAKPLNTYLGCFKDGGQRDLDGLGGNKHVRINNTEECLKICYDANFKYAGLQHGSQCFCGNYYGRYGKIDGCGPRGGSWKNSIYQVRE